MKWQTSIWHRISWTDSIQPAGCEFWHWNKEHHIRWEPSQVGVKNISPNQQKTSKKHSFIPWRNSFWVGNQLETVIANPGDFNSHSKDNLQTYTRILRYVQTERTSLSPFELLIIRYFLLLDKIPPAPTIWLDKDRKNLIKNLIRMSRQSNIGILSAMRQTVVAISS